MNTCNCCEKETEFITECGTGLSNPLSNKNLCASCFHLSPNRKNTKDVLDKFDVIEFCVFTSDDLSGISLLGKEFIGCKFVDVNFERAEFRDVTFRECVFTNCNLNYSKFLDCDLFECDIMACKAVFAKFHFTRIVNVKRNNFLGSSFNQCFISANSIPCINSQESITFDAYEFLNKMKELLMNAKRSSNIEEFEEVYNKLFQIIKFEELLTTFEIKE